MQIAPETFPRLFRIAEVPTHREARLRRIVTWRVFGYYASRDYQRYQLTPKKLLQGLAKAKRNARLLVDGLKSRPLQYAIRDVDLDRVFADYQARRRPHADIDRAESLQEAEARLLNEDFDWAMQSVQMDHAEAQIGADINVLSDLAKRLDETYRRNLTVRGSPPVGKAQNASNLPLQQLSSQIISLWKETLGRPEVIFAKNLKFLRFANAVYALVGHSGSHSTLRDRFRPKKGAIEVGED